MRSTQRTRNPRVGPGLTGPVLSDLAAESTARIAVMDARWAALTLAGQALDYAVTPTPRDALADVLRMVGLTVDEAAVRWPR